jgi:hypothetical protein
MSLAEVDVLEEDRRVQMCAGPTGYDPPGAVGRRRLVQAVRERNP